MKTWHIQTWGAGTPHYLVSAETKEDAWKMVEADWKKKYGNSAGKVGGLSTPERYIHQTENDLKEIVGLTTQTSLIIDLNKN